MRLLIIGAGKQAELAYRAFKEEETWAAGYFHPKYDISSFVVEGAYLERDLVVPGIPVLIMEHQPSGGDFFFHVAVTFAQLNGLRSRLYQTCKDKGWKPVSYIAPTAVVPSTVVLGEHAFISPLNNIDDYVTVGDCVYLHSSNHIGHHSTIRDNVFVSSGVTISGMCDIGENSFIGVGASIAHGIKIGARCIIGAGTYINRDVPDDSVVKRYSDKPVEGMKSSEVKL